MGILKTYLRVLGLLAPEKFTLVRDGRIRLLVNNKPYEVVLDRLSEDDRAFAKQLEESVNRK